MAQVEIRIRNLEKLTELADKFPALTRRHIDGAIVESIGRIDIKTKPITPVKTGRLRNSMIPIFSPFKGVYGSPVGYASRVHDLYSAGTPYRNPSLNKNALAGFLEVGVKRAIREIEMVMEKALKNIVKDLIR